MKCPQRNESCRSAVRSPKILRSGAVLAADRKYKQGFRVTSDYGCYGDSPWVACGGGEAFTLRLDGSQPSIDTAHVQSRDFVRFAFGKPPDSLTFNDMPSRPLRPGLGDAGEPVVYEMVHHLTVPDDGSGKTSTLPVLGS